MQNNALQALLPAPMEEPSAGKLALLSQDAAGGSLALNEAEALQVVRAYERGLRLGGRIQLEDCLPRQLYLAFCDSPFLNPRAAAQTLAELAEIFCYFRREIGDTLSDEELLAFMRQSFDGPCQGSPELLEGRELEALARRLLGGEAEPEESHESYNGSAGEGR